MRFVFGLNTKVFSVHCPHMAAAQAPLSLRLSLTAHSWSQTSAQSHSRSGCQSCTHHTHTPRCKTQHLVLHYEENCLLTCPKAKLTQRGCPLMPCSSSRACLEVAGLTVIAINWFHIFLQLHLSAGSLVAPPLSCCFFMKSTILVL